MDLPTRGINPATKKNAAWQLSNLLNAILGWATNPQAEPLSVGWWDRCKQDISEAADVAIRSFDGDHETLRKIRQSRKLTFKFVGLLHHNPSLSSTAVQDWTVQAYRVLFDDLSSLQRELGAMGDAEGAPSEPVKTKHVGTTSGPSGQSENKISQPSAVSEFYKLQKSAKWKDKSKASIHRHIADDNAKKQGCKLTDEERTTEAECIKKAIRDYEKKVAKLQ